MDSRTHLQNCPRENRRGEELFKSEKNAILNFYDLGLKVGPKPSRQTNKPYSFAELPKRKEERRRAFQV
jgi:hypothetical protein